MADFRCYFLDAQNHIIFPAEVAAEDLGAAKLCALTVLQDREPQFGATLQTIEIWQGNIMLDRSLRPDRAGILDND